MIGLDLDDGVEDGIEYVDVVVDDDTDNVDSVDNVTPCVKSNGCSLSSLCVSPPRSPAPQSATLAPAPSTSTTARTEMAMVTVLEPLGFTPS